MLKASEWQRGGWREKMKAKKKLKFIAFQEGQALIGDTRLAQSYWHALPDNIQPQCKKHVGKYTTKPSESPPGKAGQQSTEEQTSAQSESQTAQSFHLILEMQCYPFCKS